MRCCASVGPVDCMGLKGRARLTLRIGLYLRGIVSPFVVVVITSYNIVEWRERANRLPTNKTIIADITSYVKECDLVVSSGRKCNVTQCYVLWAGKSLISK